MGKINFFSEEIDFKIPKRQITSHWIKRVIELEGQRLAELNFIFCTDNYLVSINQRYLDHDTFTDIVTFNNSEEEGIIEGDIFISVERVRENAAAMKVDETAELNRVIIHGVLHLLGYSDKTAAEKSTMRKKEDACLSLLSET